MFFFSFFDFALFYFGSQDASSSRKSKLHLDSAKSWKQPKKPINV